MESINGSGDLFTGPEHCSYFEKELWSELVKRMYRKHRLTFQDHIKYTHNYIVNPFRVGILQYAEHVCKMHSLAKYPPPPSTKGGDYDEADWAVHDK